MWATAEESREQIVSLYRRVWAHSNATIDALALDAIGHVPWWPQDRREVTLHRISMHMMAETDRLLATPISSGNSSTGPLGCGRATTTCRQATRLGGRATAAGWSLSPGRPPRPELSRRPSCHYGGVWRTRSEVA
jgi:hypothetical protein